MASLLSIIPSPLPPFSGLSYSARARKPLGCGDGGCAVKLTNNSLPLVIRPLPSRSRSRKALAVPGAVQAICMGFPVPVMSNRTPFRALVSRNPLPVTSMIIGLQLGAVVSPLVPEIGATAPLRQGSVGASHCILTGRHGRTEKIANTTPCAPKWNKGNHLFLVIRCFLCETILTAFLHSTE